MLKSNKASLFLAYKSITRGNKGTLILTALLMTLAFVNLIFISSIFLGMITSMNEGSVDNEWSNIVVEPEEDEDYIKRVKSIQTLINSVPGVVSSSRHYIIGAVESYDENKDGKGIKSTNRPIKSINPADEKQVTKIHQGMVAGKYLDKSDRNKILLGREVSGGYGANFENEGLGGVQVGNKIKVLFSNGIEREYEVKGIFSTKCIGADQLAFITEREMESVLGTHNMASEILVKIDQTGQEEEFIKIFRQIGIVKEEIKPWTEYMGFITSVTKSFGMINLILGTIGSIVAGITIFVIIFVNVTNKRMQIGILKAIGIEEKIIVKSYILQALFYVVLGVVLGLIITYSVIVPYFIKNPLDFPMGWVSLDVTKDNLVISSISLIVAALAGGLIPAWRTSRESILKAIWG